MNSLCKQQLIILIFAIPQDYFLLLWRSMALSTWNLVKILHYVITWTVKYMPFFFIWKNWNNHVKTYRLDFDSKSFTMSESNMTLEKVINGTGMLKQSLMYLLLNCLFAMHFVELPLISPKNSKLLLFIYTVKVRWFFFLIITHYLILTKTELHLNVVTPHFNFLCELR